MSDDKRWTGLVEKFERGVVVVLVGLLMVVVAVSTVELGWILVRDLSTWGGKLALDVEETLELFGFFMLVLIGLELIATLKAFMGGGVVHGEVVLEVALIAMAQKIIILDPSRGSWLSLMGLAVLVVALAGSFWLLRAARRSGGS